ncbi:MAG: hypothetical protein ACUVX8_00525 [Candidatus Zipacnadales bacterium]
MGEPRTKKPRRPRDRREATFIEHLEELRQRLIRCAVYITVAAVVTFVARHHLI